MSVPGLAVLFGGLVQKKWVVNTMFMTFAGFAAVLIVWVLWAYNMGFGSAWFHGCQLQMDGRRHIQVLPELRGQTGHDAQRHVPRKPGGAYRRSTPGMPAFAIPQASVIYFQFVFAAITPLLFLGSVLGRIKFKVWVIFVPLWTSFAYAVNAFCFGAAASGRTRVRATSPVATSSTWPPVPAASWLRPLSVPA